MQVSLKLRSLSVVEITGRVISTRVHKTRSGFISVSDSELIARVAFITRFCHAEEESGSVLR